MCVENRSPSPESPFDSPFNWQQHTSMAKIAIKAPKVFQWKGTRSEQLSAKNTVPLRLCAFAVKKNLKQ